MITLNELFDVAWTFTQADITARNEKGRFIHEFIFANEYNVSIHQWNRIEEDKLTIVLGKINVHGDATRGGAEMAWGYKKNSIPDALMTAPVTHLSMNANWGGNGSRVSIDIETNETAMEIVKHSLKNKALKWEDNNDI